MVTVRNDKENSPVGVYYNGTGAGVEPRLIAGHKVVMMVLLLWPKGDTRLGTGGPMWWQRQGWKNFENVEEINEK